MVKNKKNSKNNKNNKNSAEETLSTSFRVAGQHLI